MNKINIIPTCGTCIKKNGNQPPCEDKRTCIHREAKLNERKV